MATALRQWRGPATCGNGGANEGSERVTSVLRCATLDLWSRSGSPCTCSPGTLSSSRQRRVPELVRVAAFSCSAPAGAGFPRRSPKSSGTAGGPGRRERGTSRPSSGQPQPDPGLHRDEPCRLGAELSVLGRTMRLWPTSSPRRASATASPPPGCRPSVSSSITRPGACGSTGSGWTTWTSRPRRPRGSSSPSSRETGSALPSRQVEPARESAPQLGEHRLRKHRHESHEQVRRRFSTTGGVGRSRP